MSSHEGTEPKDISYYRNVAALAEHAAELEHEEYDREGAAAIFGRLGELALDEAHMPAYARFPGAGEQRERVDAKAELLREYDLFFAGPVARLREAIAGPEPPEPLAETPMAKVYAMKVGRVEYVVRFVDPQPQVPFIDEEDVPSPQRAADRYAHDLYKGRRVMREDVERISGINYGSGQEKPVVVSRRQPGRPVGGKFDMERMQRVTGQQMHTLFDALEALYNEGLDYDSALGNLLYDAEAGFSIVDFNNHNQHFETFEETVADCIGSCVAFPRGRQVPADERAMRLALFDRFAAVCQERYENTPFWPAMQMHIARAREQDLYPVTATPWDSVIPAEQALPSGGLSIEAVRAQLAYVDGQLDEAMQGLHVDMERTSRALESLRAALEGSTSPDASEAMRQLDAATNRLQSVIQHLRHARGEAGEFRDGL